VRSPVAPPRPRACRCLAAHRRRRTVPPSSPTSHTATSSCPLLVDVRSGLQPDVHSSIIRQAHCIAHACHRLAGNRAHGVVAFLEDALDQALPGGELLAPLAHGPEEPFERLDQLLLHFDVADTTLT